ncbi:ferredoxin family protein [Nitrogeniibacter aestuarii]|uniref:ferredoxin family protein n=1 Tax=Nitrogeniibacter aestuarii TaxID=2815343 RepID=UPI001E462D81|nr:ferredoxin family protein [Nitrogeniibacter aestuarii]
MTYAVTSGCINCKFSDCVEVCPTDAFHEGPNMLVIHPEDCIDCGLCEPECPEKAIFADTDLPDDELNALDINTRLAECWPVICKCIDPMPEAERWSGVANKWPLLEIEAGVLAMETDAS